jgi:hypothetical protein
MAVFTAVELRGGWIQGLGRVYFKEIPSRGESVQITGVNAEEVGWYEVLDVELTTDATTAGNIVLRLKSSDAPDVPTRQGVFLLAERPHTD